MEDNIKSNNMCETQIMNKDKLGLKKIKEFNLNKKIKSLYKFPSGHFVSINNNKIIIWNNDFNNIQEFNFEEDYKLYKENLNNIMKKKNKLIALNSDDEMSDESDNNFDNSSLGLNENLNIPNDIFLFENEHETNQNNKKDILYIENDDNFGIIYYNNILLYSKENNQFKLSEIIFEAHNHQINCIFFYLHKLITYSKVIKIWEKEKNKYQCISIINLGNIIHPISIEKDNIIIALNTKIVKLNLIELKIIDSFNTINNLNSKIKKIYNDIYVELFKIETFIKYKKNRSIIKINYEIFAICPIKNQDFFLGGGKNNDIRFFDINNGNCFRGIVNKSKALIYGIIQLNNDSILTYTYLGEVKIWEFDLNYKSIY